MTNLAPALLCALILTTPSASPAADVPLFAPCEVTLTSTGQSGNPYTAIAVDVRLTPPNGGTVRTLPMFWDGGTTWKFRVAPDEVGEWSWSVTSGDSGLDGKTGHFTVVPSDEHGSIRPRSDAPQHFETQDGKPFWFLGDTAWALVTDKAEEHHDRSAAQRYLAARAEQGFNVVHTMFLSEAGWGNSGGPPWTDIAAQQINPGYWQEVDKRVAYANRQGLVVGIALAWGNKRNVEPYSWGRFPDVAARLRYARYIAARYAAYNVFFIVSGEWHGEVRNRQQSEEDVRSEFIAIGDALHAADPHDRMVAIHPMTSGGSVREFNVADWMSFGDYQQNYNRLHQRIIDSRQFNKPIVNSEYGYHLRDSNGDGIPDKDNSTSLESMRHATWDIVTAGGYVVTGFGTTYFGGNRDPGPFDLEAAKNDDWERQIGLIRPFFEQLDYWTLEPHDELLRCGTSRGKDGKESGHTAPPQTTYWCLAEPGRQYVLYARGVTQPVELALDKPTPALSATLFNPRTGETKSLGHTEGERYSFTPPDEHDWVVVLR